MPVQEEEKLKLKSFKKFFSKRRILMVDDDPQWITAVRMLLDSLGASISTAGNAADAVKYLRAASYDLILLDIQMPGIDGWDLYAIMKQVCPHQRLPVFFLTGLAPAFQTKFIAKLPISSEHVLQKSLPPLEILARIQEQLEKGNKL